MKIIEKGLIAPRVTQNGIDALIGGDDYYVFPDTSVTICLLRLKNGFCVTGESACVSPDNFDADLGRKIVYNQARNKIWALEGYLLRERLTDGAAQTAL